MKRVIQIAILVFLTAAVAYAADSLTDEVRYEWINISSRRDVADLMSSGDGYYVAYRGGGAAYYDIAGGSYRLFGISQGLTHLYLTGIGEDDDYLYFATRNGLTKYDKATGESERIIRMWGNAYNDCTGVAVIDRYVYVSTIEGGRRFDKQFGPPVEVMDLKPGDRPLSKQVNDGWEIYYNPGGVVTEDLYSVIVGSDGTAYWGGYDRIPVLHPDDSWSVIEPDIELGNITRLRFIGGRLAAFGTIAGGYYLDTETGHCETILETLADTHLGDGLVLDDYTYLGGRDGLYVARNDGKKFKIPVGIPVESIGKKKRKKKSALWLITDEIGGAEVNRIVEVNGIVVIGTTDGVYHYSLEIGEIEKATIPGGLSGPAVYSLLRHNDALFAAGYAGLDRIAFNAVGTVPSITSYSAPEPLRDLVIHDDGIVTLGAKAIYRLEDDVLSAVLDFSAVGIAGGGRCLQVLDSPSGAHLYVGTSQQLFALNPYFEVNEEFGGLRGNDIVGLAASGDTLYVATRFDGLYGFTPGYGFEYMFHIDSDTGLSGEEILSLYADEEIVCVGLYDKGVDILTPELKFVDNITWGDGLSHTDVFAVAYDAPYLWVSIRDVGVNAYNLETGERDDIRKYYARYGLGDEFCRDIEILGPGNGYEHCIAFATASGVSILCYEGDTPPDLTVGDVDGGYK